MPPPAPRFDRIDIDLRANEVRTEAGGVSEVHGLATPEAFRAVSAAWLRVGWDTKYVYGFSWLGRPIIQLPEDVMRLQELITAVAPDVVVETGIAHGGSLVLHASILKALGRGRVIGVDIEIRPHNRTAIEQHVLAPMITLVEGSSTDPAVLDDVRSAIADDDVVLVVLDSNHTKAHVASELECYAPLVTPGSLIVAMDGIMAEVVGAPRTEDDWSWNNPAEAAREFVDAHPEFELQEPPFPFNEGLVEDRVTYFPGGIIRRVC